MAFESQWADWQPKEPTLRTDKTDKSPSVSFVSASPGRIWPLEGREAHSGAAVHEWRDWYEERAAIAEHDGGLPRAEAEAAAYECCIVACLNCHPPIQDDPGQCIHCGERMVETEALPFLTGDGRHVWMHSGCHSEWMARRRAVATAGLATMGIRQGSGD